MSGRGKGGKGLGKGGAKRHRKVLRDNIQGITKPAIRRLARRGGVKRISGLIYEEIRARSRSSSRTSSATPSRRTPQKDGHRHDSAPSEQRVSSASSSSRLDDASLKGPIVEQQKRWPRLNWGHGEREGIQPCAPWRRNRTGRQPHPHLAYARQGSRTRQGSREVPYSNGRAVVAGPVVNLWRWCLRSIVLQLRVGRRVVALLARGRHADRWGRRRTGAGEPAAMRSSASDDTNSCKQSGVAQTTSFCRRPGPLRCLVTAKRDCESHPKPPPEKTVRVL